MTRRALFARTGLLAAMALAAASASAQETKTDWAWKHILDHDGVGFYYIFYSEADNENNGIVFKLVNRNDYPVLYSFLAVFKAIDDEVERTVSGRIAAKSIVTGEVEGLFFIPFKDGKSVGEIGLKAYRVSRTR